MEQRGVDPKRAERVLGVLYKMSNGIAGVKVSRAALLEEVNRSGVLRMTDKEYAEWKALEVTKARALRN